MKALVLQDKLNISLKNIPEPVERKGEVLVEVLFCGICGSDWSKYLYKGARKSPFILGHEFCGIVASKNSEHYGKLVAIKPFLYCDRCSFCLSNNRQLCENHQFIGSDIDGGMQQMISVPESCILCVDEFKSDMILAALLEPLSIAVHAVGLVQNYSKLRVAIVGYGTIGRLIHKTLLNLGVCLDENIQVIDRGTEFNTSSVDICFECSGSVGGLNSAMTITKPRGKIVQVGILYPQNIQTSTEVPQMDLIPRKELQVIGSWNSNYVEDWQISKDLLVRHSEDYKNIIDRVVSLQQAEIIFKEKQRSDKKIIINLQSED